MKAGIVKRFLVCLVAVALLSGGIGHIDLPIASAEGAAAEAPHRSDHRSADEACLSDDQHPPCGACFLSVDMDIGIGAGDGVSPPGISVPVSIPAGRGFAIGPDRANPIRAPPLASV